MYIDFHTHHPARGGERVILDGRDTWGIHPWQAHLPHTLPHGPGTLLAIGECGLDTHAPAPMPTQTDVLRAQLRMAEEWRLPVILHCVKCLDTLLALHKAMRPSVPWILHGFRGKPQQLRSLLDAGVHVSFGFRFNPESLVACPTERLLLETDEDTRPVGLLYQEVARLRGVSTESLEADMQEQFQRLFARHDRHAQAHQQDNSGDRQSKKERAHEE
ncbi:MAG TPA: hydrolase TatD [Prevotellaceae bacterium]|nr:hydrolase TatD [Prevotellaceae bacterium]